MAKKRKAPAATHITTRKTEAPMVVSRTSINVEIDHDEVARRAYARFQARGGAHGFHVEDWLAAEAELRMSAAS